MYDEFCYVKEKRKRKRQLNRQQFWKTSTGFLAFFLFLFSFFFFSSLFVWKSSIGRKTFWKYEGADGIVFNEVWPELHLPLSRHLGPAAVTLPRAQFKKLAGTHPSFLQIRFSSIYLRFYRALNPSLPPFFRPSIDIFDRSSRCVIVHIYTYII